MHIICAICSDFLNHTENIYVTKCGHVFHHHCLAQWLERSQSCPQCRHKVTDKWMFRFYPTISEETGEDAATLKSRLDDTSLQLRQQKAICKEAEDKLIAITADLMKNEVLLKSYEMKLVKRDSSISALKDQAEYLKIQNKEVKMLREENVGLKKSVQTLEGLQKILTSNSNDVEQMLQGYTDLKTVATFATALKRALFDSESKKNMYRDRMHAATDQLALERRHVTELHSKIAQLEDQVATAERNYDALKEKLSASEKAQASVEQPSPRQLRRSAMSNPNSATPNGSNAESKREAVKGKRKASEIVEKAMEQPSSKLRRRSCVPDLNTAILNDSTSSLNSMVKRTENSDSPYLRLKQCSLALSELQRKPSRIPTATSKPSENALLRGSRRPAGIAAKSQNTSIFNKKQPLKLDPRDKPAVIDLDATYDGLGGHSKPDTFPVPLRANSAVPRLTARHKLRRPTPGTSQDNKNKK